MAFPTREGGTMRRHRTQFRGFLLTIALGAAGRLAREMWPDGLPDQVQSEGSTCRLNISAPQPAVRAPWLDDDPQVTRRPTGGSIYHDEMLRQIVPEEFRASTFHPAGVSID